jgi:hypothetical protein
MNSPQREFHPLRPKNDIENHNFTIVDDLLNGLTNWRAEQDIIRLTFKAILDILKCQSSTIRNIELDLPTKALKSDLSHILMLKSGQSELTRSINDVKQTLDSKISADEVFSLMNEKVSKNELAYQLSSKANYEEIRSSYCEKSEIRELHSELRLLKSDFSQFSEENFVKNQNYQIEIEEILQEIKANRQELEQALEEKANKQSVANALHRKANKVDVEAILNEKVDFELQKLSESLQNVQQDLQEQLNVFDARLEKTVTKVEHEESVSSLHVLRKELENKSFSHFSSLEGFVSSVKSELEDLSSVFYSENSKISAELKLKLNESNFKEAEQRFKQDQSHLLETFSQFKSDFLRYQDLSSDRNVKLELCCKGIQDEVLSLHQDLKQTNETIRLSTEKNRESLEEGLKSYQNLMANVLEDNKKVSIHLEAVKRDLSDLDSKKIDKLDSRKLIDAKVDLRDLQESLDKMYRECIKVILSRCEELRESLNRKEKELILLIEAKPGVHEVNSLILDQNLASVRKTYVIENHEDRYMRSSELKDSQQYVEIFKHH